MTHVRAFVEYWSNGVQGHQSILDRVNVCQPYQQHDKIPWQLQQHQDTVTKLPLYTVLNFVLCKVKLILDVHCVGI
jgi:hypothetical protein